MEKLSRESIEQLQLERFQSTLNRSYQKVPFYRNRFQEFQLDPSEFKSLGDLVYLPFTTREDISDHYPYGMFAVPLRDILRIYTSVGTGANPTVVGFANRDLANWKEIVSRCLKIAGVTPDDIIQVVFDYGLANWGRDFKDGAEAIEASIIPMYHLPAEKQLLVMRDYKTSVLITTPSLALHLSLALENLDFTAQRLALKTCLLLGEQFGEETRKEIEDAFGVKAWGAYGLSEVPGPCIAFECKEEHGFHVSEDHFLVEIVDPETAKPLPTGEPGELVITTITTKAFPLIRFRTGDKAKFMKDSCSCGLNFRRLEFLPGRTDGLVAIRGIKIDLDQIASTIRKRLAGSNPAYVMTISREQFLEIVELWIAIDDSLFCDKIKSLEMLSWFVRKDLQDILGINVRVKLVEPPTLEPFREQLGKIVQRDLLEK